jgi:SAM-dependent methyltransferase
VPDRSAKLGKLVREIYEERPYPSTFKSSGAWSLVPPPWIRAVCNRSTNFQKILIAGCGTGDEAFRMRRAHPDAEIVAIDFSRRSIALAKRLQAKSRHLRPIRLEVADLSAPDFPQLGGRDFDFISCHGVLSYIARPEAALRNFARCLKPNGVLYIGVNGLTHASVTLRETLPLFGFDIATMKEDNAYLRRVLRLCDRIAGRTGANGVAKFKPEHLAGDVFGPVILNLSLRKWVRLARGTGLHFRGSYYAWRQMRSVLAADDGRLMMPRSRAEVCQLADRMYPHSFHRVLFTPEQEPNPPWNNANALMRCSAQWTNLYRGPIPNPRRTSRAMTNFRLTSRATNTRLDWHLPGWLLPILRQADGRRSLGEIATDLSLDIPATVLQRHLYLLHQLLVITLLPPSVAARVR